jgi:hypothetical protein
MAVGILGLALLIAAPSSGPASGTAEGGVLPAGRQLQLNQHLVPERPTVIVFLRPADSTERRVVRALREKVGAKAAFRLAYLSNRSEPLARQYEITRTPTALVYDRRARFVGRSSHVDEIDTLVSRAAQLMRIDWAEPGDPRHAEMDRILGRSGSVGIMRTMSLRPEWLRQMTQLKRLQNQPSAIDAHTKDLVAAYVSALNKCKY